VLHIVTMREEDARLLAEFQGQPLDSLWSDGRTVLLRSGTRALSFTPDEVPWPDGRYPGLAAVTLRVEERFGAGAATPAEAEWNRICGPLGRILHASRAITAFAPPPPRLDYFHPAEPAVAELERRDERPLARVDFGIGIDGERDQMIIATDGCRPAVFAAHAGAEEPRLGALRFRAVLVPIFLTEGEEES
jgi:hypothetical protein